jgi:hypothetical protein
MSIAILVTGACAVRRPPQVASAPPVEVQPDLSQFEYACGDGHPFGLDLLEHPGGAELEDHPSASAVRAFLAAPDIDADFLPESGWLLAGRDATSASYLAPVDADAPFADARLELTAGEWKVVGWCQGRPQLALDGAGPAIFMFTEPPAAGDRFIRVVVTELACASGQPMGLTSEHRWFTAMLTSAVLPSGRPPRRASRPARQSLDTREARPRRTNRSAASRRAAVFPFHDPALPWP